ncbi:hypothetical protein A7U60_g9128 [Sanghuangporus baumii]|uniref:DUF6533 domain-containing protein n=1 Tax=Sanghuangporus baumii TaxID=108892 RepID=A0A9Q5HQ38_SANBA|nr:hypothetical protein A7U60_g9128 [Sanghuangporus baumii]
MSDLTAEAVWVANPADDTRLITARERWCIAWFAVMPRSTAFAHRTILSARADVEYIDPGLVPLWVLEDNIAQFFQVAIVTVLVYDAVITLDKEVKYFWKFPWNMVTFVYFMIRYAGILGAVAALFCNFSGWTKNAANWITIISVDYILVIRVLALYSQDKRLTIVLNALLTLEAIAKFALFIYLNVLERIAIFGLAKDVTFCVLALYKAAEYWRLSSGFKGLTLVKVLIQDQVMYFALAIACCIFNIMEFEVYFANGLLAGLFYALGSPSFLCVLGSRMLFNLKEAGKMKRIAWKTMVPHDWPVMLMK